MLSWHGSQQRLRVGMRRCREYLGAGTIFHYPSRFHHGDLVADLCCHPQVVGDDQTFDPVVNAVSAAFIVLAVVALVIIERTVGLTKAI